MKIDHIWVDYKELIVALLILLVVFTITTMVFAKRGGIPGAPTFECRDSIDNDRDGFIDLEDAGCKNKGDKDESNCGDAVCEGDETVANCAEDCRCIPSPEICDYIDNDCDGEIDENLVQQCGVSDVGVCKYGTQTCFNGEWSSCVGNIDPTSEICDYIDNDCDEEIDENLVQQCGTSNVGACKFGNQTCSNGIWGSCVGNIEPTTETCNNIDDDCDSVVDEGCDCAHGQTQNCGIDTGLCESGTQTCLAGEWSACVGEVGPSTEICDWYDNDCDGYIDEDNVCGNVTNQS